MSCLLNKRRIWNAIFLFTYISHFLKIGIVPFAETWMNPETDTQSEASKKEKNKRCTLTHTRGIQKNGTRWAHLQSRIWDRCREPYILSAQCSVVNCGRSITQQSSPCTPLLYLRLYTLWIAIFHLPLPQQLATIILLSSSIYLIILETS